MSGVPEKSTCALFSLASNRFIERSRKTKPIEIKKKLRGALWALEPKDTAGYRSAVVVHPWDENTDLDKPSGRSAGSELENGTRSYDERMLKERTRRSPDNADVQF